MNDPSINYQAMKSPSRNHQPMPFWVVAVSCLLLWSLFLPGAAVADDLQRARELIDAGEPEEALEEILNPWIRRHSTDAQALLLRSTARFMVDDPIRGRQDLDLALELDPSLRQGWLNRAALYLSEGRYSSALQALLQARELDPSAADNDLNIGAVLLLMNRREEAQASLGRYLVAHSDSAEAEYLVASNYASVSWAEPALRHLSRAIELEERSRLRARADGNFTPLAGDSRFQQLLSRDTYRLPSGARQERRTYPVAYDAREARLLGAVLDAVRAAGLSFDPRVEVTSEWALVWGELRIKVSGTGGTGVVEVSAPAESLTETQWQQRTARLFQAVDAELAKRGG